MKSKDDMIWSLLLHLGYNMWADRDATDWGVAHIGMRPYLRFDESQWRDLLERAVKSGINQIVLDLGEGVQYQSHPELTVKGSWSPEKLRAELDTMRRMGLEPIPKLNFATTHDAWMGEYARMVSTEAYYAVCRDLIAEVIALFDGPRYFHLGMDEEDYNHQRRYAYVVVRQYDLWWHDLCFFVDQVEKAGVRPWVWSDYVWDHADVFYQKMPKSVLQSNWYYANDFGPEALRAAAYVGLEAHGYDQIPTGSNWSTTENMGLTAEFCREQIAPERLKGFLMTPWKPTLEVERAHHEQAIDLLAQVIKAWRS